MGRGGAQRTNLVLLSEHIRFVNEDIQVHIRVLLISSDHKVDQFLDGLLIQVLERH